MDIKNYMENTSTPEFTSDFIQKSYSLKPENLFIDELKWKYLIRSVIRGKNIMMVGPSGCGKTISAHAVQSVLNRPKFYFNLGATQDPRSSLIGNTHFKTGEGTIFSESLFVKSIRTENSIILLDELTRAHPDAWNILMTVLDYEQRYLRLDEKSDYETVFVAPGVTFIATANIGNEYTATRVLDRAILDRFLIIEVPVLNSEEEFKLLKHSYPNLDPDILYNIARIAGETRNAINSESSKISTIISTRMTKEMAGLISDGFTLSDAAEVAIYPFYSIEGGTDSERSYIKKIVQKYNVVKNTKISSKPELFTNADFDYLKSLNIQAED